MPKFLTTAGNSYQIEQTIINAKEILILVTPYLQLSKNLMDRLNDANKRNVKITLIYGKQNLNERENVKLNNLNNLEIYYCENLHSKCYLNENDLIISSMNLYEYSERNNREMGIYFTKTDDLNIYENTSQEIESIIQNSHLKKVIKSFARKNLETFENDEFEKIYLRKLFEIIKNNFPNHSSYFDEKSNKNVINIIDFPLKNINTKINNIVEIKSDYKTRGKIFQFNKEIDSKITDRVYLNKDYYKLNIYPNKKFSPKLDENGIIETIANKLNVINYVYNIFELLENRKELI